MAGRLADVVNASLIMSSTVNKDLEHSMTAPSPSSSEFQDMSDSITGTSIKTETRPVPVLIEPITYPFDESAFGWFMLFGGSCFNFYMGAKFFFSTGNIWVMIIFLVLSLYFLSLWQKFRDRKRRALFLATYQFPPSIKREVGKRYPHLSDEQLSAVLQGLRQYFQLSNGAEREMISMPSRAVDVAWHEFILSTRSYALFCEGGLGRFLHHIPAEEFESSEMIANGLKAAWRLACKWEAINQRSPSRLPFLFAIDTELIIPDGLNYPLNNDYATDEGEGGGINGCGGGCGGGC